MVTSARIGALLASVALAGCYDMERLDPGPESYYLLIDDFEDGNAFPSVPGFGQWRVLPFKPGPGASAAIDLVEPSFDGSRCLVGQFSFTDPGGGDFTGASIGIAATRDTLDVRRYRFIHVTARFDPGPTQLPNNTRFYAELTCDSARPLGNVTGPFYVQRVIQPVTSDWQAYRLDRFAEPSPEEPRIAGGPSACLAAVDAVRFTISTNLGGGVATGGRLYIDDVYFE